MEKLKVSNVFPVLDHSVLIHFPILSDESHS